MISPTGMGVRIVDDYGRGRYGARRDNDHRIHRGTDFICDPGQGVVSPLGDKAKVVRISKPYDNDPRWSGLLLRGLNIEVYLWYVLPTPGIVGGWVRQGDVIGTAQDISVKHPGMIPHIHLQIKSINPELFISYI